jgi:branched-chain amino acid transport system permease protein
MSTDARTDALPRRLPRTLPGPTGILGSLLVLVVVAWLLANLAKTPGDFFQILLFGLSLGAIYALVALGYTLVYGILELINFAHGDVFMFGGTVSAVFILEVFSLGSHEHWYVLWPVVAACVVISMAICGTMNALIEMVAYRPLRNAPRLAPLITAVGMSFILQDVVLGWRGPNYITVPTLLPRSDVFAVGSVSYRWDELIVLLVTVPLLLGLVYLIQRTKQGKAMRATAQDQEAAAMMGINVNRTISFTFLVAGALAGAGGLVYVLWQGQVRFDSGFRLGLISFTAAVLGGIGNLPGAVLGALVIGLVQAFNEGLSWAAPGSDWTQSIVFSILILILVFRPEGLLGEKTPEGQ